jgi:hypothetical protein
MIVVLQGCVIVLLLCKVCIIVALQGCVIVVLQGCVIVLLRARLRVNNNITIMIVVLKRLKKHQTTKGLWVGGWEKSESKNYIPATLGCS